MRFDNVRFSIQSFVARESELDEKAARIRRFGQRIEETMSTLVEKTPMPRRIEFETYLRRDRLAETPAGALCKLPSFFHVSRCNGSPSDTRSRPPD